MHVAITRKHMWKLSADVGPPLSATFRNKQNISGLPRTVVHPLNASRKPGEVEVQWQVLQKGFTVQLYEKNLLQLMHLMRQQKQTIQCRTGTKRLTGNICWRAFCEAAPWYNGTEQANDWHSHRNLSESSGHAGLISRPHQRTKAELSL